MKVKLILFLITILPSIASAQLSIPAEFNYPEMIYFLIIPAASTFILIFAIFSRISPLSSGKIKAMLSLLIIIALIYSGILTYIVKTLSSIDYYLPIFAFIILFFIGINTYIRGRTYRISRRRISRKKLPKLISQKDRQITRIDREIDRLEIIEKQLEEQYAAVKNESYRKRIEKIRKRRSRLANKRDRLIQEKNMFKRMYKESVE